MDFRIRLQKCRIFFQGELETFAVAVREGLCQLDALKTTMRIGEGEKLSLRHSFTLRVCQP